MLYDSQGIKNSFCFFPSIPVDTVADTFTRYGALNKARVFQGLQVLGNGRLRRQLRYDIVADAGVYTCKMLQNGDPRRMP